MNLEGLKILMLAVSANRTRVNFEHKHACLTHNCKFDKIHIDERTHLKLDFKVTEFN